MGVGVVLWVAGEQFLVKYVTDSMLPSPFTDPYVVILNVLVCVNPCLHYLLTGRNFHQEGYLL
jgi:hypothetical protein